MQPTVRWGLWPRALDRRQPLPWPARLLIIGPAGLGDTVVTLPALSEIRSESPQTKIAWIAPSAFQPILALAGIDDFIASDFIASDVVPSRTVAAADFGALLTFADVDVTSYAHLGPLAAIPHRIGSANGGLQGRWCNHLVHVKRLGRPRHEAQRQFRLLIPFGVDVDVPLPVLSRRGALPPCDHATPADLPRERYVVLHAFSAGHAREWPISHWIELASAIVASGRSVVLTGSTKEARRMADAWPPAARPTTVFDAFGRLDLAQLSGLLSRTDAVVAASTGPLHLAAALGVPTLGLFVPRAGMDLSRWAPLGAKARAMQSREHCARSCDAQSCRCMRELAPQAVAAAVAVLARAGAIVSPSDDLPFARPPACGQAPR